MLWALRQCADRRQRAAARPRERGAGCATSLRSRCSSRPPMLEAFVDFGLFMSILGAALLLAMLRDDAAQCAFARVRLLPAVPHLFQLSTLAADLGRLLQDRQRVGWGKSVSVRVGIGGRRVLKK